MTDVKEKRFNTGGRRLLWLAAFGFTAVLASAAMLYASCGRTAGGGMNTVKKSKTDGALVFFGDSMTYYGEWEEYFPGREVYDLGVCGDKVSDLIERFDEVRRLAPGELFIMVGINDLLSGYTEAETLESWNELLSLADGLEGCAVYVESVLPVGEAYGYSGGSIRAFNSRLRELALEHGAEYIELFPLYDDGSGYLYEDYTADGLHLTPAAYKPWVDAVRALIGE